MRRLNPACLRRAGFLAINPLHLDTRCCKLNFLLALIFSAY